MAHKITWLNKPGYTPRTFNPISGCSKISAGCVNCYAEKMSKRLAGRFGYPADKPFAVTFHPDRLAEPQTWKKPSMVFVNSMSDLFHPEVKDEWIEQIFKVITENHKHIFLVLTKRPEFAADWYYRFNYMHNLWLGVTVENQATADLRIPTLRQISGHHTFISVEPMLERINLGYIGTNWVICGGETGNKARFFNTDWAMDIREQCELAEVPFFFKSYGSNSNVEQTALLTRMILENSKNFPT